MEHLNHSSSNISGISLQDQVGTGILGVCFLLGVPANVAVVAFLLRHLKKDNFTFHLLLNLAASDILRLVSVLQWMYNLNFAWALGRGLCKVTYIHFYPSANAGMLTVTLISVQRYVVVLHRSQWTKLGSKGEKLLLFCLWTVALIFSSPAAVKADLADGQNKVCRRITDGETLGILLFETLVGFALPFSIMAMFYFCLHKKVKDTPLFRSPRLTRLVIAILITFFILWIPYHALNLVRIVGLAQRSTNPTDEERIQTNNGNNSSSNSSKSSSVFTGQTAELIMDDHNNNNTSNAHTSSEVSGMSSGELVGLCVRVPVCLVGLVGNLLVLILLPRHLKAKKYNFTLRLMLHLAVCDVLCMLVLPVWMYGLHSGWDTLGLLTCQAVCYVVYTCLSVSTMAVSLMSVHRYVQVLYRRQWERLGVRGEGLLLASVWLASCLSAIPSVSLYTLLHEDNNHGNSSSSTLTVCEKSPVSEGQKVGVLLYETLVAFVFPLITLVTAYFSLHHKVSQKTGQGEAGCGSARKDATRSLRFLVMAIVVIFFLLYLPYHVVNVMTIFTPLSHNPQTTLSPLSSDLRTTLTHRLPYGSARVIVEAVGLMNSCINPFLYAFAYLRLRHRKTATTLGLTRSNKDDTLDQIIQEQHLTS